MLHTIYQRLFAPLFRFFAKIGNYIWYKVLFIDKIAIWHEQNSYPVMFNLFSVLRFTWFVLLMVFMGLFALTGTDQSQDMLVDLNEDIKAMFAAKGTVRDLPYLLFIIGALGFWAFMCWFNARIMLKTFHIDQISVSAKTPWYTTGLIRHLPRWLGAAPYFIVALGAFKFDKRDYDTSPLAFSFLVLGIATYLLFKFRAPLMDWVADRKAVRNFMGKWADSLRADPKRFSVEEVELNRRGLLVFRGSIIFSACMLFIFLIPDFGSAFAIILHPGTLIVLALAGWMSFGTIILRETLRSKIPVFLILFVYTAAVSQCNDNHAIRQAGKMRVVDDRLEIRQAFKLWLVDMMQQKKFAANDSIPVVVVGAQGGGIRAMNWTASVLQKFSTTPELRDFRSHVFAMSGASGGSVGEAIFAAYSFDGAPSTPIVKMLTGDYLSPVTAGLLYPDMVQKALPFKIASFDRSRRLEDSWAKRYTDNYSRSTLDSNFLSLWNGKQRLHVPHLLLNSVLAESGQKSIVSDLKIDETYFPDAIDVIEETGYDMPLKTAALTSARFPYITPGGLIYFKNQVEGGHLIDGGYLENTGLVTAMSVIACINDFIKDKSDTLLITDLDTIVIPQHIKEHVAPVLMFLQNSDFNYGIAKPTTTGHEASIPLKGFINSWDREGVALDQQMRRLSAKLERKVTYVKFELDRNTDVSLPLGWFLSDRAAEI
ncbi:MAG: hypothetical protein ACRCYO_15680, partial [Bacteroidia bacterium]